jgi:hypothetical protein
METGTDTSGLSPAKVWYQSHGKQSFSISHFPRYDFNHGFSANIQEGNVPHQLLQCAGILDAT